MFFDALLPGAQIQSAPAAALAGAASIGSSATSSFAVKTYRPSQLQLSVQRTSSDGRYWPNYPQGGHPTTLQGSASIGATVSSTLSTGIRLAGQAGAAASASATLGNLARKSLLVNIGEVAYFDPQQMFLNVLLQSGSNAEEALHPWNTLSSGGSDTNEQGYLASVLDVDGYATTLSVSGIPGGQQFSQISTGFFVGISSAPGAAIAYPGGSYRFQMTGKGTVVFTGDASATCTSGINGVSQFTITVTPSSGLHLKVTSIPDPANYPRAMSLVQTSLTSSYDAGAIFHPNFLNSLSACSPSVLRFMDTLKTNTQLQGGAGGFKQNLSLTSANSGATSVTLSSQTWPYPSGTFLVSFSNGQDIQATCTHGSSTITLGTALSSTCSAWLWVSMQNGFAGRPLTTNFSYSSAKGVPIEICVALCNGISADCWLCLPPTLSGSDWTSYANLVKAQLSSAQKAYIEWSNEVWNGPLNESLHYCVQKSIALFGSNAYAADYHGAQTAQMASAFASAYGNPAFDNRVVVVQGGQAANTGWLTEALSAPQWVSQGNTAPWQQTSVSGQKLIKGAAIAPYFGQGSIPTADYTFLTGQPDGGYTDFFGSLTANPTDGHTFTDGTSNLPSGGWFGQASGWVASNVSAMASYGHLPVMCYEGGWQFDINGGAGQQTFLVTAARDSRMTAALATYWVAMVTAGSVLPAQYNFCSAYGPFQWGLVESPMQLANGSTTARLQGAINYVNGL